MEVLNEHCLQHIFDFLTPLDWIQVSQVCKLWKTAVLRQWYRINEVNYNSLSPGVKIKCFKRPRIPAEVTEKIVFYAAPFVKVFKAQSVRKGSLNFVKFGPYLYPTVNSEINKILEILAKNSTEITELFFHTGTDSDIKWLKILFETNKIKKVCIEHLDASSYRDFKTETVEDVEDLELHFSDRISQPFKQYFPNLKILSLTFNDHAMEVYNCNLHEILRGITNLLKLKVLSLRFNKAKRFNFEFIEEVKTRYTDSFLNELPICCPNLRALILSGDIRIEGHQLHFLMTLPNLKNLVADHVIGFSSNVLPEMKNLIYCKIRFFNTTFDNLSLCDAVRKMPNLLHLDINGLEIEQAFEVVRMVIVAAVEQKKDVIIIDCWFRRKLKITRKNYQKALDLDDKQIQDLTLTISSHSKTFVDDVSDFVRENVKHHQVLIIRYGLDAILALLQKLRS